MAISVSKKRSRLPKKAEAEELGSFISVLSKLLCRIPAVLLVLVLLFLWSSSTTIISGNIVHVCVSSRRLNNLYCLSAGTQPNFEIPVSIVHNTSSSTSTTPEMVDVFVENPVPIADNSTGNERDEVENAVKIVEEQLRAHRSWTANGNTGDCNGRGVFVYDLPPKFNKELVDHCYDMIPWMDFCKYLSNEALGEPILKLGKGWHQTHQYSLEPIFHSRVLKHPCRVYNQNEAKLFYVPFYGGLDILRWHFKNVSSDVKDTLGLELIQWLESQQPWIRNSGKDHVFVLGKISWDFRRNNKISWGTRFLELDQMQNPIKLLIERQPWHMNDIGIPHPTHFHPHSDDDIITWQLKIMRSKRKNLVSFAGAARPGAPENIRSILIKQCTSSDTGKCQFLNCDSGDCRQPESIIELFMESEFCLQPPGDSPTRKSVFDSLVSGCIPVLFDSFTAYYQYPWHLPEDHTRYSVFIDQEDVRSMKMNVVERLMKVSVREREDMRRYIVYELLPGLVYGDSSSEFDKFQDAFSISMNNLLERISRLDSTSVN
ncbi:hypothetical protein VitviT2T_001986 [Vitis vinifera]|nr:xyloglucan-specific galacturonosyltransferase 1 [Vitis vinifera]RVX09154.1 Xyloglucan-specific galacturonosyltransferase 1 [Vitis vinifera]WJZ82209.1 hypothetical protein VitviT2T_001986 [Vitis vinifera]|eukprot:XP_010661990.1 PREDICTED: xyloglucan-specific galacturonosyltransferase 1 [Vitis vinifera]